MVKKLLPAFACLGLMFCAELYTIPDDDLSADDISDITRLARTFSPRPIQSISAGPTIYCGPWVVESGPYDYTGSVVFDSMYTDTDRISYEHLEFYHRRWYAYEHYPPPEDWIVSVNDWYSTKSHFSREEKTVMTIDTLTIIIGTSGQWDKAWAVGLMNHVYAMSNDTADTNYAKVPEGFSFEKTSAARLYTHGDTTELSLETESGLCYPGLKYIFSFAAGVFLCARVEPAFWI